MSAPKSSGTAVLIGRLAVQLKLISMQQLAEATRIQTREPEKLLGDILEEQGFISRAQHEKLVRVQEQVLAKHREKLAQRVPPQPGEPAAVRKADSAAAGGDPAEKQGRPLPRQSRPAPPPAEPAASRVEQQQSQPAPNRSQVEQGQSRLAPPPDMAARPASGPEGRAQRGEAERRHDEGRAQRAPARGAHAGGERSQDEGERGEAGDGLALGLAEPTPADAERIHEILRDAVGAGASDIHVHANAPVRLRVNGHLAETGGAPLDAAGSERLIAAVLSPEQRAVLRADGELDLCYAAPGIGRFRTNVYRQQRGFDAVFRAISDTPPTREQLGLPSTLARFTNYHQGLVLVTGPAGCGKSSTMAALVNMINEEREEHILTVEDPIEYVHQSKRCLVNQRHAGRHTGSFARALRAALREDPDVIVIGELRDLETISLAITAAETGHLVLATLHTSNAVRTINRIIGAFPSNRQDQVRTMLSESLRAVITQRLVEKADESGRVVALEILVVNKAIANLVREQKTVQIRSAIQTGAAHGMMLLEQSLARLVSEGKISKEEALRYAEDKKLVGGGG